MTNRVISYIFKGNFSDLNAGTLTATRNQQALNASMKKTEAQGAKTGKGIGLVGVGLTGVAIGGVAALGAIEKATMGFDKAMSNVQAATHATAAEMASFRGAALDASKTTQYSAAEAAGAIEALAKAGISTKDILGGGLTGALNLAAAGSLDVGQAAEYAASAMTQFHLQGDQVGHIADLLAAGAGKAQGDVSDLGMALAQSGLVASQTGLSIEETTGTLAAFASAGLIGSDAGTSFKTMLQALTPNSKQAREEMDHLGISAYDAQGNFVGMAKFAGNLRQALSGLSTEQQNAALKTIFGSDAVRAASVIYQDGADGIQGWIDKTNDAGYAAETAAIKLDNLSGDLKKLGAALNAQAIDSGEGSQGFLREMTQSLTDLVNLGGTKVPVFNQSVEQIGQNLAKQGSGLDAVSSSLKSWSHWLGIGSDSTKKSGDEAKKAADATETYANAVGYSSVTAQDAGDNIDALVKAMKEQRSAALSAFDAVTQYGQALDAARAAAAKGKRGIDANTKAGRENRGALSQLASAWNNQSDAVRNSEGKFRSARKAFIDTATAMGVPIGQARRLARSLLDIPNRTVVTVDANVDPAAAAIARIRGQLASIPRSVRTDYYVNQVNAVNKGRHADGGPIYGPGTATSDSIPAYLSNGEYVIKAASVQKYGVAMFDRLNAGHFAGGGYAGGGVARSRVGGVDISGLGVTAALKRFQSALENSSKALDDEKQARDSLRSSVASGLTRDLTAGGSAFAGQFAAGSVGAANAALRQQLADARQFSALEKQLRQRGLSGQALQEVLASGDINRLRQFASASNADLSAYQLLYGQATSAVATAAAGASQVTGHDATVAALTRQTSAQEAAIKSIEQLMNRHHKETQKTLKAQAADIAHALNQSARGARRG